MLLLGGTTVLLGTVAYLGYCAFTLPLPGGLAAAPAPPALTLEADNGEPFAIRGLYRGTPFSAQTLPPVLVKAVVSIEDRRFFENPGFDVWGILRAAIHDLITGSESQGASTITQQLARLTFLSPKRSIHRKVQEAMLALWLASHLSKRQILARYLNSAYFGDGAVGADAAARRYFGIDAQHLDLAQAAMLAGLIQAPTALAPTHNLAAAQHRAAMVLEAMLRAGYITPAQAAAARAHPAVPKLPPATEPGENYFADAVVPAVTTILGTPPTDLVVRTTLDPALQSAAERVVARDLARYGRGRHVSEAALVALAPDGAVLAMVGGLNYGRSQFNRATQALRQPGSLFKIFVYLTAFENGFSPDSVLVDQPVQIGNWQPRDYDRRYLGPVTLREAFAQSINTVSAQLGQDVGIRQVIATAKKLGVTTPLQPVPSLALGSEGVTLYEMTGAMAAIAADAKSLTSYAVDAIYTGRGMPLYVHRDRPPPRADGDNSDMREILRAVVTSGTGAAAALPDYRVYGKTGTTNDYRDAWFVGFTSDFVVGVWVGNDDNSPMRKVVGGYLPAHIWHDFVAEAERIKTREGIPGPVPPTATAGIQEHKLPPLHDATADAHGSDAGSLTGIPFVINTATLLLHGRLVHLQGIEGEAGTAAREMARYIGGRPIRCEPVDPARARYRCTVNGYDLGEAVLYNGGGRATSNASAALKSAQERARSARRGIWQQ